VTAVRVGSRHGKPVVWIVQAARILAAGHTFFPSGNGARFTEHVPPEFLTWPELPEQPQQPEPPS